MRASGGLHPEDCPTGNRVGWVAVWSAMSSRIQLFSGSALAAAVLGTAVLSGVGHAQATTDEPASPSSSINRLGSELQVSESSSLGNLVFSPFSVAVAMSMASGGAVGDTAADMADVLGIVSPEDHAALGSLVTAVQERSRGSFTAANSLWTQEGLAITPAFDTLLVEHYAGEMQLADFAGDPRAALDEVNGWVDDATEGRIPALLNEDQITALTRFVVLNAAYLDATWESPFDSASTHAGAFTTGDGSRVETDLMAQVMAAEYAAAGGTQAIVMPYENGIEMVVVLPVEGGLVEFEQDLADADGNLESVLGEFAETQVDLQLPSWDIGTLADLVPQFEGLGMTLPFGDAADFSGITTDEQLRIGAVVHQANITVDEQGTEAAAATAVIAPEGAVASPGPEPTAMTVDRPFFFVVRDTESGAALFQGHVNDPSARA